MKKKGIMLIGFVLSAFLAIGMVCAQEAAMEIDTSIKIGVDNHMPPYSYINDNGILKGFYVDLIHAIAIERGIDIEIRPMSFYDAQKELVTGNLDLIIGSNQAQLYDNYVVSNPIIQSSEVIFVRMDNQHIIEPEDLGLSDVAMQKGNVNTSYLRFLDLDRINYVDNQQQGILRIMNGNSGAFIGDKLTGLYTIQKWKQENFIKVIGGDKDKKSYYFVSMDQNQKYLSVLNSGLQTIRADGTYDKIYTKWFGETIATNFQLNERILIWLKIGIGFLLLLSIAIMYWNSLLKRQVEIRTKELNIKNSELENSNRFRKDVLDNVLSGIVTIDKEGRITLLNSRMHDMLSKIGEAHLGQKLSKTPLAPVYLEADFKRVLETGESFRNRETEIQIQERRIPFLFHVDPLRENNGTIGGVIINIRDVSAEKNLEEELQRQDRLNAFGLMVAGFAHEIRNPLTTIKNFTDMLPSKIENPRFKKKFMDIVPAEVDRLNNLIREILDFSRIRILTVDTVDLKDLVSDVLAVFRERTDEKSMVVSNHVPVGLKARGNREKLKQVFDNLVSNAYEAMPEGGKFQVSGGLAKGMVALHFQDNGKGMSEEVLKRIFDPFFTTKSRGTGLGLFVSYQIIKEMKGEIRYESKYGRGTTVTVLLPLTEEKEVSHE
jgi:polar amino acid transport system substrate-binding protein